MHFSDGRKTDNSMKILLNKGSALQDSLDDQQLKRWKPFAAFKRRIDRRTVMSSPAGKIASHIENNPLVLLKLSGIVRDLLPGEYNTSNLADYTDLPPIEPQKTIVYGVRWIEGIGYRIKQH